MLGNFRTKIDCQLINETPIANLIHINININITTVVVKTGPREFCIVILNFQIVTCLISRFICVNMAAPKKFHSSIFHPTLRKWQECNVDIAPENLMYPLFLMFVSSILFQFLIKII